MSRVQLGRWVKGNGQGQVGRGGGWVQPGQGTVGDGHLGFLLCRMSFWHQEHGLIRLLLLFHHSEHTD